MYREAVPNSFESTSFFSVFMKLLNADNFRGILELMEYSDDFVKAKVSIFLLLLLLIFSVSNYID